MKTTIGNELLAKIERLVRYSAQYSCQRSHKTNAVPNTCFACVIESEINALNSRLDSYFDALPLQMNRDPHVGASVVGNAKEVISARVRIVVAKYVGKLPDQINTTDTLTSLGTDSLDLVEIVMALEEEFETEIYDEYVEKFTTVQSIIDYLYDNT